MKVFITGIFVILSYLSLHAQPVLQIRPGELEYEDIFHRLQNAYFINTGNEPLIIDSIYYSHNDFYYLRFNRSWRYPITIEPGDSIMMDCILSGYLNYTYEDTVDTLFVYNNSFNPYAYLKVKIDYYEDNFYSGIMQGNISSEGSPVSNADVYFLYGGNFVIARTISDAAGNYSAELPVGNYTVAAGSDSFYVSFYNQQYEPLSAAQIFVDTNSVALADFNLVRKSPSPNSISGTIYDSLAIYPLKKGIVVVRSGTHTPSKVIPSKLNSPALDGAYTAFVNPDGSYAVDDIIDSGYYFVQSFSDYFIPAYYDSLGNNPSFWQNADSIYIGSQISNADIYMPRDSSIGGGIISGTVGIAGNRDSSVTDAIVYAQSAENNLITYAFSQTNGNFRENFLPYGSYYLVAQKIGYANAVSDKIIIDSSMTNIGDVTLLFSAPNSIKDHPLNPDKIELYQNYPNPFNPSTTVEFFLPGGTNVTVRITNILGQTVSILHSGYLNSGDYKIQFDGIRLSSGIYFVSLITQNTSLVRKIMLLK
jgi:hypothetical protein